MSNRRVTDRYQLNGRGYGTHQAIADLVRPGARVLDVGCAGGHLAVLLRATRSAIVVGVEPDVEAAEYARRRGVDVITGDVQSPDTRANVREVGQFDHIVCADVLEHMAEPDPAVRMLIELLAPDGTLVASIPNVVSLRARARILRGTWRYEETGIFDRTHLRFYDPRSARELLERNGLTVVNVVPVGPLSHRLGKRGVRLTAVRPHLLANQVVLAGARS